MKSRAVSALVIVISSSLLLWIAPRWLGLGNETSHETMILPPPQADRSGGAVDPGCATAVRELSAIPHPPVVAGGRVHAATVNGVPIATCIFQTPGACIDVMDFYAGRLIANGWQDVTERHFQPPAGGVHNDADAEKYDALRSTHAMFVKKGRTFAITLKPAALARCSVNITCAGTTDLPGFWQSAFDKSERLARKGGADAWLESREPRAGGTGATRFYTSRGNPDDLIAGIASDMRSQGWSPVLPPRDDNSRVKACMFIKPGGAWAFATARHDERKNVSRAVLMVE